MPRIAILTHEQDDTTKTPYLIFHAAKLWQQRGIEVETQRGLGPALDVDLAIHQIDLTVTPEVYREHIAQYPRVINGHVFDISKRHISRHLVHKGDGYEGPAIVKTNENYGGLQELRLQRGNLLPRGLVADRLRYRLVRSTSEIPDQVWNDPLWVVERLLWERAGDLYCLRTWVFLGDAESHSLSYSKAPIVKSHGVVKREQLGEVPAALRQRREELGFDFGKFDYAMVDGEVVLYDTNRTPTMGNFQGEVLAPLIERLAEGIGAFL